VSLTTSVVADWKLPARFRTVAMSCSSFLDAVVNRDLSLPDLWKQRWLSNACDCGCLAEGQLVVNE
jgi:hypothetical protein